MGSGMIASGFLHSHFPAFIGAALTVTATLLFPAHPAWASDCRACEASESGARALCSPDSPAVNSASDASDKARAQDLRVRLDKAVSDAMKAQQERPANRRFTAISQAAESKAQVSSLIASACATAARAAHGRCARPCLCKDCDSFVRNFKRWRAQAEADRNFAKRNRELAEENAGQGGFAAARRVSQRPAATPPARQARSQ